MQMRDSISVRNSVFSCFVINYSHIKDHLKRYKLVFSQKFQIITVIVRKRLLKTASKNSYPFRSYAYLIFGLEFFPQNRLEKLKIDSNNASLCDVI